MNTHDIELRSAVMGAITDVWDRAKQIDDAADEVLDLIEAARKRRGEPVDLDRFDPGFLGGQDGMPAYVWHDIIRAELDRAYDFYMDQLDRAAPQPAEPVKVPSDGLAHEIWAAAQTAPGEGIEDAVERIAALLARRIEGES